jgi:hypothetical protein
LIGLTWFISGQVVARAAIWLDTGGLQKKRNHQGARQIGRPEHLSITPARSGRK